MSARLLHHAQSLAAALPPLLIEAERLAQTVMQGVHGRRRAGTGETFWQFRRYEQGDPAERIDWRQSSRTDKIFIREREYEAAHSVYMWSDASGSMRYASRKTLSTKAERAQLILLALTSLLLRGGEKVRWTQPQVTAFGKAGLERLAARLAAFTPETNDNLPPDLALARHATMIMASDFLAPLEQWQRKTQNLASHNLRGVLLHVVDPLEENFTLQGRLEMQGCEGEDDLILPNAASLQAAYQERMNEHKRQLAVMAESAGWFYMRHVTDELPHLALMRLYQFLDAKA